jgi:predicted AlkP superfamily phosphohydrolase/phosphomutase
METGGPYAHVIPDAYARADAAIGTVLERAGDDVDVIVLSDHGFAPLRKKVHLNTWLAQRGYLAVRAQEDVEPGPLGHIDWDKTQAYALGLNQLFLNLKGREANGVVAPERRAVVLRRLVRDIESWRDSDTGQLVITRVVEPGREHFPDRAPDLVIGYNRGYRSSDESALGRVTENALEPNEGKWSGDHCMDPAHVPGVLFSSIDLRFPRAALTDMAPTILTYFGLRETAGGLPGKSILVE